ncbi:uncharacterized protein LOC121059262 isoform X2 [Cygnus olor]|uniref:uncharacterized protein LOC121059262 isoform X2 n=1 Tax=Cygnus olor TaxID=8869 RepID=UPI001ADE2858|nr:uncharacterized protein LOC121059262 isoform X2 [Cygnus olor]
MDAPQAVPSRPSLLQLLRGLFGYHRSALGTQGPRAERQEPGTTRDPGSSQGERVSPARRDPGGHQGLYWEPLGDAEREGTELLLGELRELSLEGSLGSSRSCLSAGTSDTELEVVGDGQEAPAGSGAQQDAACGVASAEAFGDKALEMDGLLQGPGAADEDITGSASPELTFSVGFDAEWDKGQLLKDQGAGSSKAELSLWNRLISMNRQHWASHKPHASGSSLGLESEEEPLLEAADSSPATLELRTEPRDALPAYRFSEDRLGETIGCFGRSRVELGASDTGALG